MKIELSLKAGAHFHCPRGSENHCFFDLLSERPPEHPLEPLLGVLGSILARFWDPLEPYFPLCLVPFFESIFNTKNVPKRDQKGREGNLQWIPYPPPLELSPTTYDAYASNLQAWT